MTSNAKASSRLASLGRTNRYDLIRGSMAQTIYARFLLKYAKRDPDLERRMSKAEAAPTPRRQSFLDVATTEASALEDVASRSARFERSWNGTISRGSRDNGTAQQEFVQQRFQSKILHRAVAK